MFTFHSSNTGSTDVTLNLNLGGTLAVGSDVGAAVASVDLSVRINGVVVGSLHSLLDSTATPISSCSSTFGGNAGCTGVTFVGAPLLTNTARVQLDVPVLVQLSLVANAFSINSGSSSSVEFGESLDFPVGPPLFNLAAGVTVDAPDSFVFNNIFAPPTSATPLPAALPLFAGGLGAIGLLARRRKRKQAV